MHQYKLTDSEARALATQIANGMWAEYHSHIKNKDYNSLVSKYMETYNCVMDAIDTYNQSLGD